MKGLRNPIGKSMCWIATVLTIVFSIACEKNRTDHGSESTTKATEGRAVTAEVENERDLTAIPHEEVNGLLLTAEVLDEYNWIVGLTWENIGDAPISVPFVSTLHNTIEDGRASPFLFEAYSRAGSRRSHPEAIVLDKGRHADARVFDLSFDGEMQRSGAYDMLCSLWGLSRSMQNAFNEYIYHTTLGIGESRTCFFRFPRLKSDEESGRWKPGEKIPVDFRFFVGEQAQGNNRVTYTSGENGQVRTESGRSGWRGEIFSNVVYLEWNAGGERVRWPTSPHWPAPAVPVNDLLLTSEIIDEEAWIVRLKWTNVGENPVEIPVNGNLFQDIRSSGKSGKPFPFYRGLYDASRHYGRIFGTALVPGSQSDVTIFKLSRDGNFMWNEKSLEKNGFFSGTRPYVTRSSTEWIHLPPGSERFIDFKFPRFESDDRFERWQERQLIPIEFCFKAGEITNSHPPYREVEEFGDKVRRRFPAWQGEVYSNLVSFKWTSDGERIKLLEKNE